MLTGGVLNWVSVWIVSAPSGFFGSAKALLRNAVRAVWALGVSRMGKGVVGSAPAGGGREPSIRVYSCLDCETGSAEGQC